MIPKDNFTRSLELRFGALGGDQAFRIVLNELVLQTIDMACGQARATTLDRQLDEQTKRADAACLERDELRRERDALTAKLHAELARSNGLQERHDQMQEQLVAEQSNTAWLKRMHAHAQDAATAPADPAGSFRWFIRKNGTSETSEGLADNAGDLRVQLSMAWHILTGNMPKPSAAAPIVACQNVIAQPAQGGAA